MTNEQLKKLEDDLWASANSLRAYGGIKASDYAVPVLGIIFLRFAENKYSHYEPEILKEYMEGKGTRLERSMESIAIAQCGFFLPEYARYKYLLNLSGDKSVAKALQRAMEGIEEYQDEKFKNVLPKEAYFEIEKRKNDILPQLLKTFSDIPKDASGDIFGKIYEYFLGEFAMSEGQKGGEFFTPTSVVRFIVEVIEPYSGAIFDPACGSGGMFVQSAKFIQEVNHSLNDIYVYGQEFMGETARLAKMNLMVNNIRGEISEVNSYESDPYQSLDRFDFVMANPPFNVKSVKESTVKNDERFYRYGLPKKKGKNTNDSISDANYLWISLFASSLNANGRAGFVMANSASDAGGSEYEIRKKIVDSGIVDCMVSMPSNMFFTVTLPATLWFFDNRKVHTDRKDKILFIDARNVYHQIDRAHREWKEEQIQNLTAIVRLYRCETDRYLELIKHYIEQAQKAMATIPEVFQDLKNKLDNSLANLKSYANESLARLNEKDQKKLEKSGLIQRINDLNLTATQIPEINAPLIVPDSNEDQIQYAEELAKYVNALQTVDEKLKANKDTLLEVWTEADKTLKLKNDKSWAEYGLVALPKILDEFLLNWKDSIEEVAYWHTHMDWLQSRFPQAEYQDVTGLCKLADRDEYVEEQNYSLNAGRYVGVDIEEMMVSKKEFYKNIFYLKKEYSKLVEAGNEIEYTIIKNLESLI